MSQRLTEYEQAPYLAPVIKGKTYLGKPHERGVEYAKSAGVDETVAKELLGFAAGTDKPLHFSHPAVNELAIASQELPTLAIRAGIEIITATILAGKKRVTVNGPAKEIFEDLKTKVRLEKNR